MLKSLIEKNRSYRRFHQEHNIPFEILKELINLARLSPSGGNLQPLKFFLSNTPENNKLIFPHLKWAGYLKGWNGPEEGERPSAYIIILGNFNYNKIIEYDAGIAAQSILLGAVEKGFGGCIVGSIQRKELHKILNLPDDFRILLIIALGKPKEKVIIESVKENNIEYWRDSNGIHHVPKRSLDELIINIINLGTVFKKHI